MSKEQVENPTEGQPDTSSYAISVPEAARAKIKDQTRIRTDRFRRTYANSVAVSFSIWDMAFIFGEIIGEQDGKPIIEEMNQIVLTKEVAKAFAGILLENLEAYEKVMGEIEIPAKRPVILPAEESEPAELEE